MVKKTEAKLRNRESLYEQDPLFYCEYFKVNLQRGYTLDEIRETLGFSHFCIDQWREKYLEFEQALVEGRTPQIECAENRLLQLVNGFTYIKKKKEITKNYAGEEEVKTTEETITIPPSFHAVRFFLLNLRRDKWSAENKIEAQQDLLSLIQNASENELKAVRQALLEARAKKALTINTVSDEPQMIEKEKEEEEK